MKEKEKKMFIVLLIALVEIEFVVDFVVVFLFYNNLF